ncbi:MAG: hypothetical protein K6G69_07545 [Lachnospiraceae bacterium]|nr:hypothetical protein [Lachnospiraceae bacterium]
MRHRSHTGLIIVLIILLLFVLTAGALYVVFGAGIMLRGSWEREIDLTEDVRDGISEYMSTAIGGDDIDIALGEGDIRIKSVLTIGRDGTWVETVDRQSYEEAVVKSKACLEESVKALLEKRLADAYIESNRSVDELVNAALGMELDKYLDKCAPTVLPSYESLQEMYGSNTGYEAKNDKVMLTDTGKEITFKASSDMLVLIYTKEAVVYTRVKEVGENVE